MQNRGIVIVTAVLLTLASIFYLSFSVASSYFDKKAAEIKDPIARQDYKDSVKYLGVYSYQKCLETQVGLGLDLKGGMNVILEVSVPDLVENLAGFKKDAAFVKTMKAARAEEETTQEDFISLFIMHYRANAPGHNLAEVFATQQLPEVKTNSTDSHVESVLRDKVAETVADAKNVITNRIDQFGVVQPNIQMLEGQEGRIMVEMPGVKDPERMRKLLQGSANLEFWETYTAQEIAPYLQQLDGRLAGGEEAEKKAEEGVAADSTKTETATEAPAAEEKGLVLGDKKSTDKKDEAKSAADAAAADHPLLSKLMINGDQSCIVGMANMADTAAINAFIHSELAQSVLHSDVKLLWSAKPSDRIANNKRIFELYCLRMTGNDNRAPLEGDVIESAKDDFDHFTGRPVVTMQMNEDGAREWANLTKKNVGKPVAIVLDDLVYSAPNVNQEITGGNSQISGSFTVEDTKDLANTLKSGRMKAPVRIVQEEVVGPSLGAQSIKQGIISFIVAFIVLMVYMILMYGFIPGMMANCALIINLFFTLGILTSFQAALTMSGLAGIVLTLGTAVDANVLIYERIKEEMRKGLHIADAVNAGYSNAFSAIFDSNLTSLITGIILYVFGTGPIRGFATTLIIGICISFFTAVFMTRLIYDRQMKKDKWQHLTFTTNFSKNLMQNTKFNIMGQYKKSYTIWAVAAVLFVISFAVRGLSRSIDFTGGRNYVVVLEKNVPVEDVRNALKEAFVNTTGSNEGQVANTTVIALEGSNTVRVSTNWDYENNDPNVDEQAKDILYDKLKGAGLITEATADQFKAPAANGVGNDSKLGRIESSMKVGPSIAKTITRAAFISVLLALIAIFLYILLRFRNVAFSVGSIVALFFDALVVIGFFSVLWGWVPMSLEVDQTFIGAILTVIGYSINDKVVVFDRIRENLGLYPKHDKRQLFNDSINQTLARTINTSVTTLIVLLTIFVLGGDSIRPFSFAMILGVVFGTLSSIFIAAPTAYLILSRKHRKEEKAEIEKK